MRPSLCVEYEELADSGRFDEERVELLLLVAALYPRAAVRIQSAFAATIDLGEVLP